MELVIPLVFGIVSWTEGELVNLEPLEWLDDVWKLRLALTLTRVPVTHEDRKRLGTAFSPRWLDFVYGMFMAFIFLIVFLLL